MWKIHSRAMKKERERESESQRCFSPFTCHGFFASCYKDFILFAFIILAIHVLVNAQRNQPTYTQRRVRAVKTCIHTSHNVHFQIGGEVRWLGCVSEWGNIIMVWHERRRSVVQASVIFPSCTFCCLLSKIFSRNGISASQQHSQFGAVVRAKH